MAGLQDLFSTQSLERFARKEKVQEVEPLPKERILTEKQIEKKLKRKLRNEVSTESPPIKQPQSDSDESQLTVFLGNVPKSQTVKSLTTICSQFGEVTSVRLRSVPIEGTAVDEAGNQNLVRKVCVNQGKIGDQKCSLNAYVVFKEKESVDKALSLNNQFLDGRHLRADKSTPSLFDPKCTVFLGNLPHYADEEEIRTHFSKVLTNGDADIVGIRIIRDPQTLIGKGFGYLCFKDSSNCVQALTLNQIKFKKRFELRVSTCGKRTKKTTEGSKKKKIEKVVPPAMKRINLKSVQTRKRVLQEKGQQRSKKNYHESMKKVTKALNK